MPAEPTARLRCEPLEDRATPADLGSFDPSQAFPGYTGPVAVAAGDVTGDGTGDVIVAAPRGGHVKVFDGKTGDEVRSFLAYPGYNGPVAVTGIDVDRNGTADIVTTAAKDGHVEAFDGRTGALVVSAVAFPGYTGPVAVSTSPLMTSYATGYFQQVPGPLVVQAGGHVKTVDPRTGAETGSYLAFPGYTGPVRAAAGDLNYDGFADVVVSAGDGGHVKAFDGKTGAEMFGFFAYPGYAGPVEVAAADPSLGGSGYGITTRAANGHVKLFRPFDGKELSSFLDVDRDNKPDTAPDGPPGEIVVPGPEPVPGSGDTLTQIPVTA